MSEEIIYKDLRKIIRVGMSWGVTLPLKLAVSWIQRYGKEVIVEVHSDKIIIKPRRGEE